MKKNKLREVKKPEPEVKDIEGEEEVIDISDIPTQAEEKPTLKTGRLSDLELRELEAIDHRIEMAKARRENNALKRDNLALQAQLSQKEAELASLRSTQMENLVAAGKGEIDKLWDEKKKLSEEISKRHGITGRWSFDSDTGEFEETPA